MTASTENPLDSCGCRRNRGNLGRRAWDWSGGGRQNMRSMTRLLRYLPLVAVMAAAGCATAPEDEELKLIHQYEACVRDSTAQPGDSAHDPFRCDRIRDLLQALKQRRPPTETAGLQAPGMSSPPAAPQRENPPVASPAIAQAMERAMALQEAGQARRAEEEYDRILRQDPDNAQALRNRGAARAEQGRHDEAVADYDRALQLKPGDAEAHIGRGNSRVGQGRLAEAAEDYDRALQLDPDSAAAHNNRAIIETARGQDEAARNDMEQATRLAPGDADIRANRDRLTALRQNRPPPPIPVIAGDPGAEQRARGNALFDQEKYDEAIAAYDQALARNPGDGGALRERGTAKALRHDYAGAKDDLTAALRQNPNDVEARLNRARVEDLGGDRAAAIADLQRANQIDPQDKDVAEAMRRLGIGR